MVVLIASRRSSARSRCRRWDSSAAASCPMMDNSEFTDRARDAARLEPRVHAAQGRGGRAASRGAHRRSPTRTPRSADRPRRWTRRSSTCELQPKAERKRQSAGLSAAELRRELVDIGGVERRRSATNFGGTRSRSSCSCTVRTPHELAGARRTVADRGATGAGRGRRRAVDQGPEARARRGAQSRARRRRSASRVGQVAQALRPAFAGIDAGDWVDPVGETRDVTVRLAPEARTARRATWSRCRSSSAGRTAPAHGAARPGRADRASARPGADRPPRSRPGGHGRGQHRGPVAAAK